MVPVKPPGDRAFRLQRETDELFYVYDGEERYSRYGLAPADDHEREVLEAVPALLNGSLRHTWLTYEALNLYTTKLW